MPAFASECQQGWLERAGHGVRQHSLCANSTRQALGPQRGSRGPRALKHLQGYVSAPGYNLGGVLLARCCTGWTSIMAEEDVSILPTHSGKEVLLCGIWRLGEASSWIILDGPDVT